MAKTPWSGLCNTRLAPRLGLRGAARLQQALIRDRVQQALQTGCRVEVHAWPALAHPTLLRCRRLGASLHIQKSGDLGLRMRSAQARRAALIIGTDCPALSCEHMLVAAKMVASDHAVCIPANDGGYVLLGLPKQMPKVFQGIRWGGPQVFDKTRQQLRRSHARVHLMPNLPDLDTAQDFHRHRQQRWISALGQVDSRRADHRPKISDRRLFTNSMK